MQIELIAPASAATAALPRLGLGMLAALTPPGDEVVYTDEIVRRFDLERDLKDVDLVGISVDSKTARRSYDIADAYRRRGIPVVLGGIHPTALPDEAMAHADCVVTQEADDLWPRLLDDFERGALQPLRVLQRVDRERHDHGEAHGRERRHRTLHRLRERRRGDHALHRQDLTRRRVDPGAPRSI